MKYEIKPGIFVLIDREDLPLIKRYTWKVTRSGPNHAYAFNWKLGYMHRAILGVTNKKVLVDHINHDTLDNRRRNLRGVSKSQNSRNRNPQIIKYEKRGKLFRVQLRGIERMISVSGIKTRKEAEKIRLFLVNEMRL